MPVLLQNFGISLFGIKWYKRRFGGIYKQELIKYYQRESFSSADWNRFKNQQLRGILKHAYENVPYYNELFNSKNITVGICQLTCHYHFGCKLSVFPSL